MKDESDELKNLDDDYEKLKDLSNKIIPQFKEEEIKNKDIIKMMQNAMNESDLASKKVQNDISKQKKMLEEESFKMEGLKSAIKELQEK